MSAVVKSARTENARLNQLRAQQQDADRRRRLVIAGAAVGAALLVVVALVLVSVLAPKQSSTASGPLDPSVVPTLSGIPAAAFDTVALGAGVSNPPTAISSSPLTKDAKPAVLYVGAEYCPFCAAQRWPFTVAMMRFGQFSNLQAASSGAAPELFPNTPTVSFHGATYTSQYLAFTGFETETTNREPLDTLDGDTEKIVTAYNPKGTIPFIDYGGKTTSNGASVEATLFAGKSQAEIATAIADPSTAISKAVLGSANVITARLCQLTNDQPSNVCTSAGVTAAAASAQ